MEELFDDPQIKANGLVTEVEHKEAGAVKMIGPLAKFRGTPPMEAKTPSPALGQHSSEILKELGFSGEDIARWKEAGILV